jgi:formate hydrogenlyase subunit 6/NADH:ubiquinone oxidoreductase subunit I
MSRRIPGKIAANALKHIFRKPATIAYPNDELIIDPHYRGKLVFNPTNCVGCKACARDCPANALTIKNVGTKENKRFVCRLNLAHCIFCGQCVESCKKDCLSMSQQVELGNLDKTELENIEI